MYENKSKSIIIDADVHNKLKVFCRNRCMKIGGLVEELINGYLKKPKEFQKLMDELNDDK